MPIPFPPARQTTDSIQGQLTWSKSERATARKAFDRALNQELQEVIQRARKMAAEVKEPSELWELESYLTRRRKEINYKYEYRAARLAVVFATLLHEGRVSEEDLCGLREDKLKAIRSHAEFLSGRDGPI